jgi:hypothetical protein
MRVVEAKRELFAAIVKCSLEARLRINKTTDFESILQRFSLALTKMDDA